MLCTTCRLSLLHLFMLLINPHTIVSFGHAHVLPVIWRQAFAACCATPMLAHACIPMLTVWRLAAAAPLYRICLFHACFLFSRSSTRRLPPPLCTSHAHICCACLRFPPLLLSLPSCVPLMPMTCLFSHHCSHARLDMPVFLHKTLRAGYSYARCPCHSTLHA